MTQPWVSDRPEVVNVPGPAYRNRLTGRIETIPTAAETRAADGNPPELAVCEGGDDAAS